MHSKIVIDDSEVNADNAVWDNQVNVIKLHGSSEWQNQNGDLLVVGGEKEEFLQKSPLLRKYKETFGNVLKTPGMRLLIIGYSFCDKHINQVIKDAIETAGLEVWVWDVHSRSNWETYMVPLVVCDEYGGLGDGEESYPCCHFIRDSIKGYTSLRIPDIMRGNHSGNTMFHPTINEFFNQN